MGLLLFGKEKRMGRMVRCRLVAVVSRRGEVMRCTMHKGRISCCEGGCWHSCTVLVPQIPTSAMHLEKIMMAASFSSIPSEAQRPSHATDLVDYTGNA